VLSILGDGKGVIEWGGGGENKVTVAGIIKTVPACISLCC